MCKGISILKRKISSEMMDEYDLWRRVTTRAEGADEELHFTYQDPIVQLPVQHDGQLDSLQCGRRCKTFQRRQRDFSC